MELLYKYYSNDNKYAIPNLKDGQISFSPVEALNDPFEGVGAYSFQVSEDEKSYWDSIGTNVPELLSKRFSDEVRALANFKYRIFCSTEEYDNPLMWAHYANSHKGFCVGYSKADILKLADEAQKINYSDEMQSINDCDEKIFSSLLFQKSTSWGEENEFRAIYKLKKEDISVSNPDVYFSHSEFETKPKLYFLDGHVQTNNLKCLSADKYILKKCKPAVIYLGMRMGWNDKKEIIDLAHKNEITVYQMIQQQNCFQFTRKRII